MFEEDNRSDEDIIAEKRLNEQCFLLANINTFQRWGEGIQYPHLLKMSGGTPKKFIGKLVKRAGFEDISKLKPAAVSKLVPYIKLYKVYYPSEESEGVEYEMKLRAERACRTPDPPPNFSSVFQFFRSNEYSNTFVVQRWPYT